MGFTPGREQRSHTLCGMAKNLNKQKNLQYLKTKLQVDTVYGPPLWISAKIGFQYSVNAAAKSLQSYLTLCDPIDGNPPGSRVPGILQARTLEWVAISFSSAGKWKVEVKSLSRSDS